jgi:hypothetical protein
VQFDLKRMALGVVVPVVVAFFAPARSATSSPSDTGDVLPPALIVAKNAQNVKGQRDDLRPNRISVSYTVRAAYPATELLAEVRKRLEGSGWKPLSMDPVNAMRPSSHEVGWRVHVTQHPEQENFNWSGQWSNPAGDVVEYQLYYGSGPPKPGRSDPKPDNDDLRVYAALTTKKLVPVEALPASLILSSGARNVFAWRDQGRLSLTGLRYTVSATRPPSELMATIEKQLVGLGWESVTVRTTPPWVHTDTRTPAPKPAWLFEGSGPYPKWREDWQDKAGNSLIYVLSYDGAAPEPAPGAATDLHVEALLRPKAR